MVGMMPKKQVVCTDIGRTGGSPPFPESRGGSSESNLHNPTSMRGVNLGREVDRREKNHPAHLRNCRGYLVDRFRNRNEGLARTGGRIEDLGRRPVRILRKPDIRARPGSHRL